MTHDAYLWMSMSIIAAALALSAADMREQPAAPTQTAASTLSASSSSVSSLSVSAEPPAATVPAAAAAVPASPAHDPLPDRDAPRAEETAPTAEVAQPQPEDVPANLAVATVQPDLAAPAGATPLAQPEQPVSPVAVQTAALLGAANATTTARRQASRWSRLIGDNVDEELRCLALNIYWEARSEPALGRFAVAAVTLNRVSHRRFPNTVCEVVRQGETLGRHRCQFSWMCDDKSDKPENQAAWREAEHIAYSMLFLDLPDPTNGALWYHADYVSPGWAKAMARVTQIGRHLFYRAAARQARAAAGLAG